MSRAFRLGLFIVCTLAILATGVFLIGDKQFLFSSTYRLKTTFKNVGGLNNGAEVRVGGVHQGTVKQIQLPPQADGEMTVVMALKKSTKQVIRTDSMASIETEGLLGNKYVAISFGSPSAPAVADDGTIPGTPPLEIADLIKKTSEILETTRQTMGNVQESAEHFKEISAKIDGGTGTVGALVNDRKVYAQLDQMTAQAKIGAAAFQENMAALKHNFLLRGFFNRRGYEDSTKLTEHAIRELPRSSSLKTFTYQGNKLFADADSARLEREKTLNDAGRFLEEHPFGIAVVKVAASMKGDASDVETLTQARAMVVRDYLVKHFRMDDTRVKTLGSGKSEETLNDAGTVEVIIYPPTAALAPAKAAHARQ